MMLREVAMHCPAAAIGLEVIRILKSMAECFNKTWDEEDVKLVCEIAQNTIQSQHRKKSKVYQSGMALLKDLCFYKSLKQNKLQKIPLDTLKKFRAGKDSVDAPDAKRPRQDDSHDEDIDEKYQQLMEDLASSTDPEEERAIETQITELGYEPLIQ